MALLLLVLTPEAKAEPLKFRLDGVRSALRTNIELHLASLPSIEANQLPFMERNIQQAVLRATQALGYYQPKVHLHQANNSPGTLIIEVHPGDPVKIRSIVIEITGDALEDKTFQRLLQDAPLKEGSTLHHGEYEDLKNALVSTASARGYFHAQLTRHDISVYVEQQAAEIHLRLESGPRYRFGSVHYSDHSRESKPMLEHLLNFKPGQPYKAIKLGQLSSQLSTTGYFRQIDIRPLRSKAEDYEVPIYIDVTPDTKHHFEVGAGFSTDEGPRFSLSWDKPWINSKGHNLSNELRASAKRVELSSAYKVPVGHPMQQFYNLQLDYQYKNVEDTRSEKIAPSIHRWSKNPAGWDRNLFFRLHYEDFKQGLQLDQDFLLIPGIGFSRRRVKGQLDPAWGDQQTLQLEFSSRAWGSDTDFVKAWGRSKWLRTLADKHRFIGRVEQGVIFVDDVSTIPPSIRFFTGGDQTIRGFDYESISPVDSNGKLTGARYMTAASAEYAYQWAEKWRVAAFVDTGTATNDYSPGQTDWKTGAGMGLRWITPIGPLRVDLAFAVSEEDTPWRIHFSIGPDI